jgi:hypothetical protein
MVEAGRIGFEVEVSIASQVHLCFLSIEKIFELKLNKTETQRKVTERAVTLARYCSKDLDRQFKERRKEFGGNRDNVTWSLTPFIISKGHIFCIHPAYFELTKPSHATSKEFFSQFLTPRNKSRCLPLS